MGERRRGDRRADARASHSRAIPRKIQIMNQTLFGVLIFASQFLVALTLLFVAGSLIRIDLNWARAAGRRFAKRPSQLVRDPHSLEEALVEFFARSKEFSHILSVLIAHRKPLRGGDDHAGSPTRAGPATRRLRSA
jgi:hypothetical protein